MRFVSIPILLLLLLSACNSERWDKVIIDANLPKDTVYKSLDREAELFSAWESRDPLIKRTSGVRYLSNEFGDEEKFARINNCRAFYYLKSDTLSINIGIGDGHSGRGFMINYKDGLFYIEPYLATDYIDDSSPKPTYEIVNQELILNKSKYQLGDSLWGKVKFKSIETSIENKKIEHVGEGYFRTKIKEI